MNKSIRGFLREEDGITALEYGVLAAIVAATLVVVFGDNFEALFTSLFNKVKSAVGAT